MRAHIEHCGMPCRLGADPLPAPAQIAEPLNDAPIEPAPAAEEPGFPLLSFAKLALLLAVLVLAGGLYKRLHRDQPNQLLALPEHDSAKQLVKFEQPTNPPPTCDLICFG
ncbi:hypothetical protein CF326_g9341 [Tilletia indica]|nr:hypothetical protein CF326_g9341 [Tilletia indica]